MHLQLFLEKDQCSFIESLYEKWQPYQGENIILGGDFNTMLNSDLDKRGGQKSWYNKIYANFVCMLLFLLSIMKIGLYR